MRLAIRADVKHVLSRQISRPPAYPKAPPVCCRQAPVINQALVCEAEDARADRSPVEFYQLDVDMRFVTQDDVFAAIEPVLHGLFEECAEDRKVSPYPFVRIPYAEAIRKYGSDKPDLRNPIEMQNVTDHFRGSGFKVFAGMIEKDSKVEVWAIPAPGGGNPAFCDRMNSWAQGCLL